MAFGRRRRATAVGIVGAVVLGTAVLVGATGGDDAPEAATRAPTTTVDGPERSSTTIGGSSTTTAPASSLPPGTTTVPSTTVAPERDEAVAAPPTTTPVDNPHGGQQGVPVSPVPPPPPPPTYVPPTIPRPPRSEGSCVANADGTFTGRGTVFWPDGAEHAEVTFLPPNGEAVGARGSRFWFGQTSPPGAVPTCALNTVIFGGQ